MNSVFTAGPGRFSCKFAGMNSDDLEKAKSEIVWNEREAAGKVYKKQIEMVEAGFGGPDLIAVE